MTYQLYSNINLNSTAYKLYILSIREIPFKVTANVSGIVVFKLQAASTKTIVLSRQQTFRKKKRCVRDDIE